MTEEEYWSDSNIVNIMLHNRVWSMSDDEIINRFFHPINDDFYLTQYTTL